MSPRRLLPAIAASAVTVLVLGACSDSRDAGDDTLPPLSTSDASSPVVTTALPTIAPPTTAVRTTVPDTSAASTSAAATTQPPATQPPTTPPATTATPPPTTAAPTTTPGDGPSTGSGLTLGAGGIGVAAFGDDPDAVIATVEAELGRPPTRDTGWVDPFTISACPGGEYREVAWDALVLQFSDETRYAEGRRHLFGYQYGLVTQASAEPAGITLAGGVGVGSSVGDLHAAYPDASVLPGDDLQSPTFEIEGVARGILDGAEPDNIVLYIEGGAFCGG